MNIGKFIREKKRQFQQARVNKATIDTVKEAKELKALKEERLVMEGRAKIRRIREMEEAKIRAAREPSRLQRLAKGASRMQRSAKRKGYLKGTNLGQINQGSRGLQFGGAGPDYGGGRQRRSGGFNFGGGPGPDFGGKKPEQPQKKNRGDITIKISR